MRAGSRGDGGKFHNAFGSRAEPAVLDHLLLETRHHVD